MKEFLFLTMLILFCSAAFGQSAPNPGKYFAITVVDDETGRGVPLVELKTTNHISHYTDSNGIVAFYEPGLMNTDVHFLVKSHGYEYPKDGFGYAGLTLKTVEGGSAEIRIKRINIAERLYRITGQGIYTDSVLLGRKVPTTNPVIDGLVVGQDSVLDAVYKGKIYWFWGDTGKPGYPLGNFQTTGATSGIPGKGGLDPAVGVDLTYFTVADGFTKQMAPIPGPGPTWLGGLVVLPDETGRERMFAHYAKVDQAMKTLEAGIVRYNDEQDIFDKVQQMPLDAPILPGGHPFRVMDGGVDYIYFTPLTRVRADIKHLIDVTSYEAFTCMKPGSTKEKADLDRAENGKVRFDWKPNAPALFTQDEARLIKDGKMKPEDALFHIQDCETGKPVAYHGASVEWNPYRGRWVMILSEIMGTSLLGEDWYLEADTPLGPWVYARKIVTHDNYSFYNPRHHPQFDKENGRIIFFEATYTSWLTTSAPTPRYDYNQMMYKLDLSSPKLALPVAVYDVSKYGVPDKFATVSGVPTRAHDLPIAFFAPDMPGIGLARVLQTGGRLVVEPRNGPELDSKPVFYALPADTEKPPATTIGLYEYIRDSDKKHAYTTDAAWTMKGFHRSEKQICYVWMNPMTVSLPLNRYAPGP